MANFYLKSSVATERANSTAYSLGARVVIARSDTQTNYSLIRQHVYECTTAGTSGASVPTYDATVGATTTDGTVVWTTRECDSWLNANKYLDYLASRPISGDNLFISSNHSESIAGATTIQFNGTPTNPVKVISCTDSATPPVTATDGANIFTTGSAAHITVDGSIYVYGVNFNAGNTSTGSSIFLGSSGTDSSTFNSCTFEAAANTGRVRVGHSTDSSTQIIRWINCTVNYTNSAQMIDVRSKFIWDGGGCTGSTPINFFVLGNSTYKSNTEVTVTGVDFSIFSSAVNFLDESGRLPSKVVFRRCSVPVDWEGKIWSATPTQIGMHAELHNVHKSHSALQFMSESILGKVTSETTIIKSGASFSLKLESSANTSFHVPLESVELPALWDTTTGSRAISVYILSTDAALTVNDMWIEVITQNSSTSTLADLYFMTEFSILSSTPANLTQVATTGWTTTGLTSPVCYKLTVTVSNPIASMHQVKVKLGKASTTVYVDPRIEAA